MKVAAGLPWTADLWRRLSKQLTSERLGHALLLSGQEGVGKRVLWREFAQYLLCQSPVTIDPLSEPRSNGFSGPCGHCASCHLYEANSHPDLLMVEPEEEGKQIKIDQIRQVTEFVNTTAQKSGRKVVLLGPSEAMNINASNALLKSLEEPASKVTLLLYSHQPSALLATIRSRCQQYSLVAPNWGEGMAWVQRNSEQRAPDALLRLAKGAPLKALSLAEKDAHVQYLQFCQDLKDLAAQEGNWMAIMTKWKAWNIIWLIDWIYELVLDAHKIKANVGSSHLSLAELSAESEKVAKNDYPQLQGLTEKALEAQTLIRSQGNPNPVMLVENLLIDWLRLLRNSQTSHTMLAH